MSFALLLITIVTILLTLSEIGVEAQSEEMCFSANGSCKKCVALAAGCEFCTAAEARGTGLCIERGKSCIGNIRHKSVADCDKTSPPRTLPSNFDGLGIGLAGLEATVIPVVVVTVFLCGCLCIMRGNSL
jgi:hypothetical protein